MFNAELSKTEEVLTGTGTPGSGGKRETVGYQTVLRHQPTTRLTPDSTLSSAYQQVDCVLRWAAVKAVLTFSFTVRAKATH